jgi:hypothetical protein
VQTARRVEKRAVALKVSGTIGRFPITTIMRSRSILALTVTSLSLVFAGCGGDKAPSSNAPQNSKAPSAAEPSRAEPKLDTDSYVSKLNAVQQDFITDTQDLNLSSPTSRAEFKKTLTSLRSDLATLIAGMEAIAPPAQVANSHQKLVDVLIKYDTSLKDNVSDITSKDDATARKALTAISTQSTSFQNDFQATTASINSQLGVSQPTS